MILVSRDKYIIVIAPLKVIWLAPQNINVASV